MTSPPIADSPKTGMTTGAQSQSAALCVLTHEINSTNKSVCETINQWMANIGTELKLPASQIIHSEGELKIELENTCEPDALRIARLIRNSFQLNLFDNHKFSLSIGVILYQNNQSLQANSNQPSYRQKARNLALNSFSTSKSNRILFEDTTRP